MLASASSRIAQEMQKRGVAHNIVLTQPTDRKPKKSATNTGLAHEGENKPQALSPQVIIIPRKPQSAMRGDAGFNSAVLEVCGMATMHTEEAFHSASEEYIRDVIQTDMALPTTEFDDLICKV